MQGVAVTPVSLPLGASVPVLCCSCLARLTGAEFSLPVACPDVYYALNSQRGGFVSWFFPTQVREPGRWILFGLMLLGRGSAEVLLGAFHPLVPAGLNR